MDGDPVKDMIGNLEAQLTEREHLDIILNNGTGEQFEIKPSEFVEITPVKTPRKIAFVDGGDGTLYETPNFLIVINRVYFSMFKGKNRIKPKSNSRIQFFSCTTSDIQTEGGKKKVRYNTRLFARNDQDRRYMPRNEDLSSQTEGTSILQGDRLSSLGRRFAELQMALRVVEDELEQGDMIIMDGSLQTSFKNEREYARRLYNTAMQKGVIVCGLAKTSRLVTESGHPLLARIAEIAEGVSFGKWYVKVSEQVSDDDRGFMLAAKFHERSQHVFRFEILRDQFEKMDRDEINSILASMAANSHDVSMLGYPYGAIDADRFAQVRMDERSMYRRYIVTEMLKKPEWKRFQKYSDSIDMHDILNGVTS